MVTLKNIKIYIHLYIMTNGLLLPTMTDKGQTCPLVRMGALQRQDPYCQAVINIWSWAPDGARHQDWLTDWLTVSRTVLLTLTFKREYAGRHRSWVPHSSYPKVTDDLFTMIKWPKREADHSSSPPTPLTWCRIFYIYSPYDVVLRYTDDFTLKGISNTIREVSCSDLSSNADYPVWAFLVLWYSSNPPGQQSICN
jgi:hypothetical protein